MTFERQALNDDSERAVLRRMHMTAVQRYMTAETQLARIGKLCNEREQQEENSLGRLHGGGHFPAVLLTSEVRVILAGVETEPAPAAGTVDRAKVDSAVGGVLFDVSNYPNGAARHMIGRDFGGLRHKVTDAVCAALEPPETASPAAAIDRYAVEDLLKVHRRDYGCHIGGLYQHIAHHVRTLEGVVITPAEAHAAACWYTGDPRAEDVDELALAQKLEAAS